jgi:hypothetical protein
LTDWCCRFHEMMYTPEGKKTMETLWEETLEELSFARVKDALGEMHRV